MSDLGPISMADACNVLEREGWLATRPADFREAFLAAGRLRTFAAGDQNVVDLHQDVDKEFLDILYAPGRGNESVVSDGSHPFYDDIDDEFFDILYAPTGKPDEAIETPDNEAAVVCDGVSTSAKITKTNPLAENVTRTTK